MLAQIHLHHVAVDNFHIGKLRERLVQNRQQPLIELDADHAAGAAGKLRRQHSDSGANLKHAALRRRAALLGHTRTYAGVDEKILTEAFGEMETMAGEHIPDHGEIREIVHEALPVLSRTHGNQACRVDICAGAAARSKTRAAFPAARERRSSMEADRFASCFFTSIIA